MNTTWKNTERAIARILNGRRTGATGTATADVLTEHLAVEVKHRQEIPAWLKNAIAQAEAAAGGRPPLVALYESGARHTDDLVIMRLETFLQFCKAGCIPPRDVLE